MMFYQIIIMILQLINSSKFLEVYIIKEKIIYNI